MATRGIMQLIARILPEEASYIEGITCSLAGKFRSLAEDAMSQGEVAEKLVKNLEFIEVKNKKVTISQFVDFFGTTLDETIDRLFEVAQKSMTMLYSLEDAMRHLQEIDGFSREIRAITKKTNLLALNASIEAATDGTQ